MIAMSQRERRGAHRVPVSIYVSQVVGDELHRCFSTSLSMSGLYMERMTGAFGRRSRIVQVEIPLPGENDSLWAKGVVVYDCIDPLFHGTAVRFAAMADGHRRLLLDWLGEQKRSLALGDRRTNIFRAPATLIRH